MDFIGRLDHPGYIFETEEEVQPTLDGYRAFSLFGDIVPEFDDELEGGLETALMYGSNVKGLSAFPDSELYDWESDMDLLVVVDERDAARKSIMDVIDRFDPAVEINVDLKEAGELVSKMGDIREAENPETVRDMTLNIDYTDFYFEKSAPQRMRAFGSGYIPHPDYSAHTDIIDDALKSLFDLMEDDEGLERDYSRNSRDYSERIREMQLE